MSAVLGPRSFFFVRHGETDFNREGRLQGQRDVPLNALGRRQAKASGATLAGLLGRRRLRPEDLPFVCSPLERARDTMGLLRRELGLAPEPFTCDDHLKEVSFGTWEGHTWAELKERERPGVEARRRDLWAFAPPRGESYAALAERVAPWLAALGEDAVVVAHGGVARVLLHLVTGLGTTQAPRREVPQGRVLVFESCSAHWV